MNRGQRSKAIVEKKEASQRLRITEKWIYLKKSMREGCRSVTVNARWLYCDDKKHRAVITMTKSNVRWLSHNGYDGTG